MIAGRLSLAAAEIRGALVDVAAYAGLFFSCEHIDFFCIFAAVDFVVGIVAGKISKVFKPIETLAAKQILKFIDFVEFKLSAYGTAVLFGEIMDFVSSLGSKKKH